jgi:CRISPR-associated protein Csd1
MIIKSLTEYYENNLNAKNHNKEKIFPEYGYSKERVNFKLSLTKSGNFESLVFFPKILQLPCDMVLDIVRTSNPEASHFYGNEKYIFGSSFKKSTTFLDVQNHYKTKERSSPLDVFIKEHEKIFQITHNKVLESTLKFLKIVQAGSLNKSSIKEIKRLYESKKERGNIIICVDGDFLHEQKDLLKYWENKVKNHGGFYGSCMITGKKQRFQRLHGKIRGAGLSSGSTLVSFNRSAHISYVKSEGEPLAPIGARTAFAYCTILNHFLSENKNHATFDEDLYVFWTTWHKENFICRLFKKFLITEKDEESEDATLSQLNGAVNSLIKGEKPSPGAIPDDSKFSLAVLSPSGKGRLYLREFVDQPLKAMLKNVSQHYADIAFLNLQDKLPLYTLSWISVSGKSKKEKPPKNVYRSLLRSVVMGEPYSHSLALTVLKHTFKPYAKGESYRRIMQCRFLKAYLNRKYRYDYRKEITVSLDYRKEITVSLDLERRNIGYLLGRLLAISDKILWASMDCKPPNKTYEDRFLGSLGRAPLSVFKDLTDKVSAHLSKLKKNKRGLGIILDKEYTTVFSLIIAGEIPMVLDFDEQAEFIIGFQQQKHRQLTKKEGD